jgi:hypothetical protein
MISCGVALPCEPDDGGCLRRQLDRFERTRDDHATLGELGLVVVLPARPAEIEQPASFGKADGAIRIRIDEDVAVIEGGEQPDLAFDSSMPLPNTSPDMSPTPATVKGVVWMSMFISRKWRLTASQAPRAVMPIFLWS